MRKIRLFCAEGMSTSLLVTKMKKAAEEIGYECDIEARPVAEVPTHGHDCDIVLLGPQVRYELKHVQEQLPGQKVEVIDMMDYGMANGMNVIKHVKEVLGDE